MSDPARPSIGPQPPEPATLARRTRVMQVTHDLGMGGLEQVIVTLCLTMDRSRFEPSVLCLKRRGILADVLEAEGVPVILLEQPTTPRADYFAARKVARVLRDREIDVVHSHNTAAFMHGALGAALAGVRTVVHTDHARAFPDRLRYMVAEHIASRIAYRVVGVSDHTTENLHRYEWIPRRKLVTITNGIDPAAYTQPMDRAALRRANGIPENARVVGITARLTEQKAHHVLLQAVAKLSDRIPEIALVLVGQGHLEQMLRDLATDLGIANRVHFLGLRTDVPQLLRMFDVFALSSVWEGLPIVLLEAMAAGCPMVTTNVGGVGAAVKHGVTGTLVEPENPDALADAIEVVLTDEALRREYVTNAKRLFDERFSARAMTRRYEELYLRQPTSR